MGRNTESWHRPSKLRLCPPCDTVQSVVRLRSGNEWGCSSVGRALRSHRRGRGFDYPQLHSVEGILIELSSFQFYFYVGINEQLTDSKSGYLKTPILLSPFKALYKLARILQSEENTSSIRQRSEVDVSELATILTSYKFHTYATITQQFLGRVSDPAIADSMHKRIVASISTNLSIQQAFTTVEIKETESHAVVASTKSTF